MKCNEANKLLSAYSDGETGGLETAELQRHISICDSCRAELDTLNLLQGKLVQLMDESVATPDLSDAVMGLLPARRRQLNNRWIFAMAVAVLLGVIGVFGMLTTGDVEQSVKNSAKEQFQPSFLEEIDMVEQPKYTDKQVAEIHALPKKITHRVVSARKSQSYHADNSTRRHQPTKYVQDQHPEEVGKIQMAESIITSDERVDTTVILSIGDVVLSQVKAVDNNLPPNEEAANIERPPLEVVRSNLIDMMEQGGG